MRTILILPLAGVVAIAFTAGCVGERESQDSETMGPSFAPQPAVCDTRDLSKTARSFFPRDFDKQAQDLISVLAEACAAEPVGTATDEAFDVMALMEAALGGVSDLDPVDGAALATGLLPFMEFMNCESSGCVEPVFANDVLLALSERGAFAVRGGPGDPADDVVARDAVDPGTDTSAPPVWGLRPSLTWADVLGQRALLYGHPESLSGGCDSATQDCPATNEEYDWKTLPDMDGFGAQMIVGACLAIDDAVVSEAFLRMRRNATALEQAGEFFNACGFLPAAQTASLTEKVLQFLSPWDKSLVAGGKKVGPGGNASDFSDFTPLNATADATLEISAIADGNVNEPIGPIYVIARTANGTLLEKVQVRIAPENNNGSWKVTYLPGGTDSCGTDCRYTEEEGGTAVFEGLELDKTGGYRICATVKEGGGLGFTFSPEKVCSNGLNVRP